MRFLMTTKRETFAGLPFQLDFLLNFTKMIYMQYYSIFSSLEIVIVVFMVFVVLLNDAETIVLRVT